MPIYEYKCECGTEREVIRPLSEAGKKLRCDCGREMRRKFSISHFTVSVTGRDMVLGTLNQEEGAGTFPGGDKHRKRYEQAMSKGLDPPKHTIGIGF